MSWARSNDFIRKASRLRRRQSSVSKKHLTAVRTQASFILKREGGVCVCVCVVCVCVCVCGGGGGGGAVVIGGCKLLGAEILPFAAAHRGQRADAPVTSKKTDVLLYSATFYLHMNGRALHS